MSILDNGKLATNKAPKTDGDQLPGRYPEYKDGVEQPWTRREAKAIRGLAAGYHPSRVAERCSIKLRTLEGWLGNPYFMMEVQKLADHNLFRFRPAVIDAVARRAISGSSQHARIYLQVTRDLKDSPFAQNPQGGLPKDGLNDLNPDQLDEALSQEIDKLTGG